MRAFPSLAPYGETAAYAPGRPGRGGCYRRYAGGHRADVGLDRHPVIGETYGAMYNPRAGMAPPVTIILIQLSLLIEIQDSLLMICDGKKS